MQQTLLILAYMYANPGSVILLDDPDAHLEILRQRQMYNLIGEVASDTNSQIIAASHSEVLLNEAAGKDLVIAFVGKPHRIGGGPSQLRKSLAEIGFEHFYQAEQTGWVLYLEGSTDLAILRAFAKRLGKDCASRILERPFVHYIGNRFSAAERHFHGIREALPLVEGIALLDRLEGPAPDDPHLPCLVWRRREIENYLCTESTLHSYARASAMAAGPMPLFTASESNRRLAAMQDAISEVTSAMQTLGKGSPWDADAKVSDDFLTPLFQNYFARIGMPNLMEKKNFHTLADYVPEDEIDPEIGEKLDAIVAIAESATPSSDA